MPNTLVASLLSSQSESLYTVVSGFNRDEIVFFRLRIKTPLGENLVDIPNDRILNHRIVLADGSDWAESDVEPKPSGDDLFHKYTILLPDLQEQFSNFDIEKLLVSFRATLTNFDVTEFSNDVVVISTPEAPRFLLNPIRQALAEDDNETVQLVLTDAAIEDYSKTDYTVKFVVVASYKDTDGVAQWDVSSAFVAAADTIAKRLLNYQLDSAILAGGSVKVFAYAVKEFTDEAGTVFKVLSSASQEITVSNLADIDQSPAVSPIVRATYSDALIEKLKALEDIKTEDSETVSDLLGALSDGRNLANLKIEFTSNAILKVFRILGMSSALNPAADPTKIKNTLDASNVDRNSSIYFINDSKVLLRFSSRGRLTQDDKYEVNVRFADEEGDFSDPVKVLELTRDNNPIGFDKGFAVITERQLRTAAETVNLDFKTIVGRQLRWNVNIKRQNGDVVTNAGQLMTYSKFPQVFSLPKFTDVKSSYDQLEDLYLVTSQFKIQLPDEVKKAPSNFSLRFDVVTYSIDGPVTGNVVASGNLQFPAEMPVGTPFHEFNVNYTLDAPEKHFLRYYFNTQDLKDVFIPNDNTVKGKLINKQNFVGHSFGQVAILPAEKQPTSPPIDPEDPV